MKESLFTLKMRFALNDIQSCQTPRFSSDFVYILSRGIDLKKSDPTIKLEVEIDLPMLNGLYS